MMSSSSKDPEVIKQTLLESAVVYRLNFVGSIQVNASMRSLAEDLRNDVAKECIYRVCGAANLITSSAKRKSSNLSMLDDSSIELSGHDVDLVISTEAVRVLDAMNEQNSYGVKPQIHAHDMANVSFVSGGEGQTSDFMCYVGKKSDEDRRALVFDCMLCSAALVLTTFDIAFNQRIKINQARAAAAKPVVNPGTPQLISFDDAATPTGTGTDHVQTSLKSESWYHGAIDRSAAEALLTKEGDFLVRQSTSNQQQFVLTGLQNGRARHLLLIDDLGKIRTSDSEFTSIPHLVQYHRENNIPIASPESAFLLRNPVERH